MDEQLNQIIHDLSVKYSFELNEALEFISNRYFNNEYHDIIKEWSIDNLIEALKINSGSDRKKHIFSKMKDWTTHDFSKYIKQQNISVDNLKTLLMQSVENIDFIKTDKIKRKEKRNGELIKYIDRLNVGDIVDRYLVIEKCDVFAKCVYIQHFRFHSKTKEIELHLGCDFNKNNYVKNINYAYLRNRDPYVAHQSWYGIKLYVEVENIHMYKKSFCVGFINEVNKCNSQVLHDLFSNIDYPLPTDYPEDFNDLPKYLLTTEENIHKWCDILGVNYIDKHNTTIIKKQYKKKALQLHPDKNETDTTMLFQELNSAYVKLLNINNT